MTKKQYTVGYFEDPNPVDDYVECDGEYLDASDVVRLLDKLSEENEQLKSTNMEMEDYLGRLEEEKIKLEIKLQKIRDYAKEDGEVKQGIIEKVVLE